MSKADLIWTGTFIKMSQQMDDSTQPKQSPPDPILQNLDLFQLGQQAFQARHYSDARKHFEQLVNLETLQAAIHLADLYCYGYGTPIDYVQSRKYCQIALAIDETCLDALLILGWIYYWGKGCSVDYHKAKQYYETVDVVLTGKLSAMASLPADDPMKQRYQRWHRSAFSRLGHIHYAGNCGQPNYAKAADYYGRLVDSGSPDGAIYLGCMYYYGKYGLNVDYVKARKYLEMAHVHNDLDALLMLAEIYNRGLDVPMDIPKAIALLLECIEKSDPKVEEELKRAKDANTALCKLLTRSLPLETFIDLDRGFRRDNVQLKSRIIELEKKVEELQQQVEYQPEGPGYLLAKADFEAQKLTQSEPSAGTSPGTSAETPSGTSAGTSAGTPNGTSSETHFLN